MKAITKYLAEDGSEHATEDKAKERELLCAEVAEIMASLQPIPKLTGCGFENGGGYIQHYPSKIDPARRAILKAAQRYTDHKWLQQTIDKPGEVHPSYAGRIIGECCPAPLYQAWHRFECMDKSLREWGQPYYAAHPEQATQRAHRRVALMPSRKRNPRTTAPERPDRIKPKGNSSQ